MSTEATGKPILFIDIDGVLNPITPPIDMREHYRTPVTVGDGYATTSVWYAPIHGEWLLELEQRFELWWGTTWERAANRYYGPLIGLPDLPYATFPVSYGGFPGWELLYAKTKPLSELAGARPFAWIDDQITEHDQDWLDEHHPAPVLAHRIDDMRGLRHGDVDELAAWADSLHEHPGPVA